MMCWMYCVVMTFVFCIMNASFSLHDFQGQEPYYYCGCIHENSRTNVAEDDEINHSKGQDFITISLGANCQPGIHTNKNNIRFFALPFDWCITPYESLYYLISNDLKDFFKRENLIASFKKDFSPYVYDVFQKLNYISFIEHHTFVFDKQIGMIFNHDFLDNRSGTINANFESRRAKYVRRIKRFYDAINSGKHIYFIRFFDITKSQAIELYDLLKHKFPQVLFTLIVIGNDAREFNKSWNIPHIKNYLLQTKHPHEDEVSKSFWKKLCSDIVKGLVKK